MCQADCGLTSLLMPCSDGGGKGSSITDLGSGDPESGIEAHEQELIKAVKEDDLLLPVPQVRLIHPCKPPYTRPATGTHVCALTQKHLSHK